jgi:hypothetical protein
MQFWFEYSRVLILLLQKIKERELLDDIIRNYSKISIRLSCFLFDSLNLLRSIEVLSVLYYEGCEIESLQRQAQGAQGISYNAFFAVRRKWTHAL